MKLQDTVIYNGVRMTADEYRNQIKLEKKKMKLESCKSLLDRAEQKKKEKKERKRLLLISLQTNRNNS